MEDFKQPHNENSPKWKKTPLLIIGLTLLTVALVILAISPKKPTNHKSAAEIAEEKSRQAVLTVSTPTSLGNGTYQANVNIESGNSYITGADLVLTYDANVLTNVTISRGTFLSSPIELFNKVDPEEGTILLSTAATAGTTGTKGGGTFAVVTFSVVGSPSASTSINFDSKTAVTDEAHAKSILKSATGVTFNPSDLTTTTQ